VERPGGLSSQRHEASQPLRGWRRLWAPFVEFGPRDGSLYLLHRAVLATFGARAGVVAYGLYAQPIGDGAYAAVRDDPRTKVVEVAPGDPLIAAFPRPAEVIDVRYADGARCYAAVVKEQFGGYVWISRACHNEDEVRARYLLAGPAAAWDFDVYVEPELRLGRTLGRLWKGVDGLLAREGVRWSFSRISRFNALSIATHARLGAREVGRATFFVCGPLQLMVSSLRPWLYLSMSDDARPTLQITPPR
jgi:hypothetical protein